MSYFITYIHNSFETTCTRMFLKPMYVITRIWYCYCRIDSLIPCIASYRFDKLVTSHQHTRLSYICYRYTHTRLMQPTFHYVIALSTQLVRFLRGTSLSEVVFASKSSLSYTAIHWDLSDTLWIPFFTLSGVLKTITTQYTLTDLLLTHHALNTRVDEGIKSIVV